MSAIFNLAKFEQSEWLLGLLLPPWPTTLTLTLTTLPTVDKTFTLMDDNIIDIIVHITQLHVAQYVRQQFKQRRCDHDRQ